MKYDVSLIIIAYNEEKYLPIGSVVTVKDINKVADLDQWKKYGALGLVKKDNGVQAIYGSKADVLKSDINDIL